MLNSGVESQLLDILEHGINITYEEPNTDTVIIDGAALVNAKPPGAAKTFDDYASEVIVPHIKTYAERYSRVDVVFWCLCKVDEARLDLFAQKQRAYNAIPPTKGALKQHIT